MTKTDRYDVSDLIEAQYQPGMDYNYGPMEEIFNSVVTSTLRKCVRL